MAAIETLEPSPPTPQRAAHRIPLVLFGVLLGVLGVALLAALVVGPWVLGKRGDLPLERVYGDFAVSSASRLGAGDRPNPVANDRRALLAGREAYTGSCAVCHGATGDGRGIFGTSSYPNATDLRSPEAANKSDAQMFSPPRAAPRCTSRKAASCAMAPSARRPATSRFAAAAVRKRRVPCGRADPACRATPRPGSPSRSSRTCRRT